MAQETPRLTQEQINELERLNKNGDKTGVYIKYYEFTGSDQAFELGQISSFSGWLGGVAKHANRLLQEEVPNYPIGGVDKFSKDVQGEVLKAIKTDYYHPTESKGGYITDLEMVRAAQRAWLKNGLPQHFPGNAEVALEMIWEDFSKTLSSDVWKNIKNEGTRFGFKAAYEHTSDNINNIFKAGQQQKYENNPLYEKHTTSDFSLIYYTDKATGKQVYVEKSGVKAKDNVIYSASYSKEQLAQKLGIPIERIIEKIDIVDGRLNPYAAFTILPEPKQFEDSKFNWQEPNIDPASFQSAYDRYSHHSSGSTKTYEVKKGDTIWKVAKNHGMTVDELLRVPGNEYLRNHGKSFDDLGRVNILIKPGFKINIPDEQEYRQHTWNHHSTYGDPIRTTSGHYSFMNDFNLLRAR